MGNDEAMGETLTSDSSERRAKLVAGLDLRSLPIGPEEAFVLSRVDGSSSTNDIALGTGLDVSSVERALNRLFELGAIEFDGVVRPPRASPAPPRLKVASHPDLGKTPRYDPEELNELADLSAEQKKLILDSFYLLDELNHYELLQVPVDAEKKAIKAGYYKVVNVFHPDRYFGKQLGNFKHKMEQLFARVTLAHDVLTRAQTRADYDDYLRSQQQTETLARQLSDTDKLSELERAQAEIERAARGSDPDFTETDSFVVTPEPQVRRERTPMRRNTDPEVRRRALARKLRSSGAPGARISGTMPAVNVPQDVDSLREQVKQDFSTRYGQRVEKARAAQVERYVQAADGADIVKDPMSVANALRIASQLAPDDKALAERLADAEARAKAQLADHYLEQAQYEEREGRWSMAATNFEKAAAGKRSAALYDRAANCLLNGGGDMKHAGDLAKSALSLSPERSAYHITLARVYGAAKMHSSAVAEAERAVKLAPEDETAKKWLKRIRRGEY